MEKLNQMEDFDELKLPPYLEFLSMLDRWDCKYFWCQTIDKHHIISIAWADFEFGEVGEFLRVKRDG